MATAIAGKKMTRATVGVAALLAAAVAAAVGVAGHSSLTEPPPLSGDIFCKRDSEQNWYARVGAPACGAAGGVVHGGGWGGGGAKGTAARVWSPMPGGAGW